MRNIAFDGDSLTLGLGAYPGFDYPTQCIPYVLPVQAWHAFGVNGQTLANMESDAATQIDPLIVSGAVNVCVCWGGTNDLWSASAVVVMDRMRVYCQHRRAAGWKVIVLDVLPRADFGTAQNIQRAAFNADLAANWSSFADAFVSVASDTRLQTTSDSMYFAPGGIHLTEVGYGVVAKLVATQILALDPVQPIGDLSVFVQPGDVVNFLFFFRGLDTLGMVGLTPTVTVNAGTQNLVPSATAEQVSSIYQPGLYRYQYTVPTGLYGPLNAQATVTNTNVIDRAANSLYFSVPWLAYLDAPISSVGGGGTSVPPTLLTDVADIKAKAEAIQAQTDQLHFVAEAVRATGTIQLALV